MSGEIEITIHVDGAYRPFSFSDKGKAKGMYILDIRNHSSKVRNIHMLMNFGKILT